MSVTDDDFEKWNAVLSRQAERIEALERALECAVESADPTIACIQLQMGGNLRRWYPDKTPEQIALICIQKVNQEHREWTDVIGEPSEGEELADKVISECAYASKRGIDLQAEIEKKLAIVSARTDQAERDRERGIG